LQAEEQELKHRVEQRMRDQQVKKAGMVIAKWMRRRSKQLRCVQGKVLRLRKIGLAHGLLLRFS
jgi:hypothetical protein